MSQLSSVLQNLFEGEGYGRQHIFSLRISNNPHKPWHDKNMLTVQHCKHKEDRMKNDMHLTKLAVDEDR